MPKLEEVQSKTKRLDLGCLFAMFLCALVWGALAWLYYHFRCTVLGNG